jgi:hypothetical protein
MRRPPFVQTAAKASPRWRELLAQASKMHGHGEPSQASPWAMPGAELVFVLDAERTRDTGHVVLHLARRFRGNDGALSRPRALGVAPGDVRWFRDERDRRLLTVLLEPRGEYGHAASDVHDFRYDGAATRVGLRHGLGRALLPELCTGGRLLLCTVVPTGAGRSARAQWLPLAWDDGDPWRLRLRIRADDEHYIISGALVREGGACRSIAEPMLLLPSGFAISRTHISPLACPAYGWLALLREHAEVRVPCQAREQLLRALYGASPRLDLDVPAELQLSESHVCPRPHLCLCALPGAARGAPLRVSGELRFEYAGSVVEPDDPSPAIIQLEQRCLLIRDREAESAALGQLAEHGFRAASGYDSSMLTLTSPRRLGAITEALQRAGWVVSGSVEPFLSVGLDDGAGIRSGRVVGGQ